MSSFVFGLLFGMATASCCDTLLIVFGAAGVSVILRAPGTREVVILVGVVFLLAMGVLALRTSSDNQEVKSLMRPTAIVAQTVGVSLLNPHAILETVGVLGAAIAAQTAENRLEFAAGLISASWVWFFMVGLGAAILQRWLTSPVRLWIQRGSGVLMLALAGALALKLA